MKKKNKLLLLAFIVFLVLFLLLLLFKQNIHQYDETTNYYSEQIYEESVKKDIFRETYSVLKDKTIEETEKRKTVIQENAEALDKTKAEKAGMSSIYAPYYSKYGWVSQITEFSSDKMVLDFYNGGENSIIIDDEFVSFFGNNFDGYVAKSEVVEGSGELKPGESRKVIVKGDGEARYFVIGKDLEVDDWVFYRTITTNTIANDVSLPALKDLEKFVIDSVPMVSNFEEFNLLPYTTIFLDNSKYEDIKISKEEKDKYPDSCIMAMEIDLYNKMKDPLVVDSLTYIIKDSNNKNIETTTLENFKLTLEPDKRNSYYLPFKYLNQQYVYKIILNTNLGEIRIENPENIYGVIKKESVF